MKSKLFSIIRFIIESIGVAAFIFIMLQAVIISQDNQNTLNDIADKLNSVDLQVKANVIAISKKNKSIIHKHYSSFGSIQQWLGGTLK